MKPVSHSGVHAARGAGRVAGARSAALLSAAVLLAACGAAARSSGVHSLQATEAAFSRAGLAFQGEWRPNPYLRQSFPPSPFVSRSLAAHLTGWAAGVNAKTFITWSAAVFDRPTSAAAFARSLAAAHVQLLLRAGNVVYLGARLPAATRAMAQLERK